MECKEVLGCFLQHTNPRNKSSMGHVTYITIVSTLFERHNFLIIIDKKKKVIYFHKNATYI